MPLKDNIKKLRNSLGMTLEDLAQQIGVSRQTIQRYESGVISNIPSDNIEKLALALQTTPADLMGWEKNNVTSNSPVQKRNSSILLRAEEELSPETFKQLEKMAETFLALEKKKRE